MHPLQKHHAVKEQIEVLEIQNLDLREKIKWPTPDKQELQQNIFMVVEALQNGQACTKDFTGLIEHRFLLCTHIHNLPEINVIDEWIYTTEVVVTQQKRTMTSLPSGERHTTMKMIAKTTKEITIARLKQETLSRISNDVIDKSHACYNQLPVARIVATPMLKNVEQINL